MVIGEDADENEDDDDVIPFELDWQTPMVPSVPHSLFSNYSEIVSDAPRGVSFAPGGSKVSVASRTDVDDGEENDKKQPPVNSDDLIRLMDMGFEKSQSMAALRANNNVDGAIDHIFASRLVDSDPDGVVHSHNMDNRNEPPPPNPPQPIEKTTTKERRRKSQCGL